MFKLDANLLREVGLGGLRPDIANVALREMYTALETRVGWRLAERMSSGQLDEFEALIGDEDRALAWLQENFPNYREVVGEELERLKREIRRASLGIMSEVARLMGEFGDAQMN